MKGKVQYPIFEATVNAFTHETGGRRNPVDLALGKYRPHIIVTNQIPEKGGLVSLILDEYKLLGVVFLKPRVVGLVESYIIQPKVPFDIELVCVYPTRVSYDALQKGVPFLWLEGERIVGHGIIGDFIEAI